MICTKCKQEIIAEEVLETVIEKVKLKKETKEKEKIKRQPSLYNIFLSEFMKREDVKMNAPKIRMRLASEEWNKLKTQSSEEKKIIVADDDEKEKKKTKSPLNNKN